MKIDLEKTNSKIGRVLLALNAVAILTSMAAMEIFSWSLFLLVLFETIRRKTKRIGLNLESMKTPLFILLFLFLSLAVGVLTNVIGLKNQIVAIGDARWIFLLPTFALAFRWWLIEEDSKWISKWWIVVGLVSCYALLQFLTGIEIFREKEILYPFGPFWRATGLFNMPLTFAAVLGMSLCVGYAFIIWPVNKKYRSAMFVALGFLGGLAMIASLTRGAWLAFAIALLTMIALRFNKRQTFVFVCLGIIMLFVALQVPGISDRLRGLVDFSSDTYRERFELWRANFAIFRDHPFFGVGYGENYKYLPEYFDRLNITKGMVSHAHNNYFQWLGGTGAVGLGLYLALIVSIALQTLRVVRNAQWVWAAPLALGLLGAQIQVHFGGLTEACFFDGEVNHTLMMVWALALALNSSDLRSQTPSSPIQPSI